MPQSAKFAENPAEVLIHAALKSGATTLDLTGLGLTQIPESIGRLEMLEVLIARDNALTSLPHSLGALKRLRSIALRHANLRTVPEVLQSLPALEVADFTGSNLESVPTWIGELTALRVLALADNRISQLPDETGNLAGIEAIHLTRNQLESLPKSLCRLPKLRTLYLHDNEKLGIPPEILGPTRNAVVHAKAPTPRARTILDYYFRTRENARPLNEARLILLGRGAVGKTCVVNRLVRDKFVEMQRTQGIASEHWSLPIEGGKAKVHIWDFGGQEIMRAAQQLFSTPRSLYLLVLAGRQGAEDADAESWLQLIESFCGASPVIVVLNKINEQPFTLDYRGLLAKFPGIREFVSIDCKDRTGINELRRVVEREIVALKDLRASFPAEWVDIKDRLAGMAERGERFIEFETYMQICANLGEANVAAQEELAGYLHALGIALNYKDDPRLCDTHVLSPHWVANGIYSVLNWPGLEAQCGLLRAHDLAKVLDASAYPRGKYSLLLNLMRRLELCFEYPEDALGRLLVPQLLGKEQPAPAGDFDARECLNFRYDYHFMPEGLLPRFIVRTHALSTPETRWRTGVVLEFEGCGALIRADVQERKVFITVTGPQEGRRRLLAVIRSDFERIHADFKHLAVTEMVPVPGEPTWAVAYQELRIFERSGVTKAPRGFDGKIFEIDVPAMLGGVELNDVPRRTDDLLEGSAGLPIFISYSHRDEALRAELQTHLKLLQREGLISVWTDRRIPAGEDWGGQIDRRLESAEIVLLLVSADFIASHYCFDLELNRALERHEAGEAVVVPIIVRDVDLRGMHFAHLEALPRDLRSVARWPDRASAWKDVAAGLRELIEARPAAAWCGTKEPGRSAPNFQRTGRDVPTP